MIKVVEGFKISSGFSDLSKILGLRKNQYLSGFTSTAAKCADLL